MDVVLLLSGQVLHCYYSVGLFVSAVISRIISAHFILIQRHSAAGSTGWDPELKYTLDNMPVHCKSLFKQIFIRGEFRVTSLPTGFFLAGWRKLEYTEETRAEIEWTYDTPHRDWKSDFFWPEVKSNLEWDIQQAHISVTVRCPHPFGCIVC